jgi:hypothetical protein
MYNSPNYAITVTALDEPYSASENSPARKMKG